MLSRSKVSFIVEHWQEILRVGVLALALPLLKA
jgi:hypothetical protein